ncbi:MAG TPA: pyridoxal phosphate-dependent aminotransferase [Chloroflexota bacterium]|jgi:aspartate aminotransferase/aminotransferase
METLDVAALLSDRALAVESSGIRKVFDLGARLRDPINFSIGQPDFPVPAAVRQAAQAAIEAGRNRYTPTQGIEPLRVRVVEKLRRENGVEVDVDDVLITSGSSGGIFLAFAALLNPGDEIIIPDPYFVMYTQLAAFFGARSVLIDTYPDFQLDPDRVAAAITTRTKAIVLNSPANPTGAVVPEAVQREVARLAARHGLIVLSDEVYESFVYDGARHYSIGSLYPNTLTLNAFSKSHAATGWRIGYAAGPRPLIDKMKELQQYTFVCAPSFAQEAALVALDVDTSEHVRAYQRRRDLIYDGLRQRFEVVKPQGAFYIMPKVDQSDAGAFVERAIEANVLTIPGSVFSARATHIRLSYAVPEEQIRRGVEILSRL